MHQLVIDFKKAYDSIRREVMYNTQIKFVVPIITGKVNETVSE